MQVFEYLYEMVFVIGFQFGQNFVEQQQFGLGGQGFGYFQCFQFGQCQFGSGIVFGFFGQVCEGQYFVDFGCIYMVGGKVLCYDQVLLYCQFMYGLWNLEGVVDVQVCMVVQWCVQDVGFIEVDVVVGWMYQFGDGIEECSFVCVIGIDQFDYVVGVDLQCDFIDCCQVVEVY